LTGELESALAAAMRGETRFDEYSRHLYSTDASLYAIEPIGVAFPHDADDVAAAVDIAGRFDVPVLPRGAGTSLAGQTVGRAVVLDMSRHMNRLITLDAESMTARVQPGLIQDELNKGGRRASFDVRARHVDVEPRHTRRHDRQQLVRCSLGALRHDDRPCRVRGCGAIRRQPRAPRSGRRSELRRRSEGDTLEARLHRDVSSLVAKYETTIRRDTPAFWRRSGGYRLERMLPERGPFNLANLVVGSEGTLAVVVEANVKLVPQPKAVAGIAGHFATVAEAIAAAESARECDAAVIELVDRFILNLARTSAAHSKLVSVLDGDPGALLWLEFYGDTPAEARAAAARLEMRWRIEKHGYAVLRAETTADLSRFRELRKAGLGLLSAAGEHGERSVAFVEDTAVDPTKLGDYTRRFAELLDRHELRAGFYGHASAGCLHIRPFMDLTKPRSVETLRAVADEVFALVTEFGGNNSSEHGDGLVRSEFNARIFGEELYGAMRAVKQLFDPRGRFNPGRRWTRRA
jgi:FAD/FMN-containing dehydrogenase